jgi:hypothetical protein
MSIDERDEVTRDPDEVEGHAFKAKEPVRKTLDDDTDDVEAHLGASVRGEMDEGDDVEGHSAKTR